MDIIIIVIFYEMLPYAINLLQRVITEFLTCCSDEYCEPETARYNVCRKTLTYCKIIQMRVVILF